MTQQSKAKLCTLWAWLTIPIHVPWKPAWRCAGPLVHRTIREAALLALLGLGLSWAVAAIQGLREPPILGFEYVTGVGTLAFKWRYEEARLNPLNNIRWVSPYNSGHVEWRREARARWQMALSNVVARRSADPDVLAQVRDEIAPIRTSTPIKDIVIWPAQSVVWYQRLGWPWPCWEAWYAQTGGTAGGGGSQFSCGIALGIPTGMLGQEVTVGWGGSARVFQTPTCQIDQVCLAPVVPTALWPFLASVSFWGVVGLGAVRGLPLLASRIRCRLRVRSGRCARCGYNCRGLAAPVCPECGTPR